MSRRFTIGRELSCDVAVADESVSRFHAEIWLDEDGSLMLADRGSSNGTVLIRGGQSFPLTHAIIIESDRVRMGAVTLSVAELVDGVESRHPGALTPQTARPVASHGPPPIPSYNAPPPRVGAGLIRCECGAVKNFGQLCPACSQ